MNFKIKSFIKLGVILVLISSRTSLAQYRQNGHGSVPESIIPVTVPGSYDEPGATYMLQNDIHCDRSAIFLGKDVTLDLNGYTVTYADGNYGHVKNYGFEEGLAGWDISKAPGARIENTADVHAFIGEKLMRLKAGDEITSSYVYLPVAGRSYYAMCGVTGNYYEDMGGDLNKDMRVSIFVEDENGREVRVRTTYGDSSRISCPVVNRSTRLGGGFVLAHLNNLPAGNYRIRVKAENDCLVDEIDIRPCMDVGIGIVEKTDPMGHYDHLYNLEHSAFYDYTADFSTGTPVEGIPVVIGTGTVTIMNGIIRNGTVGVLSWGIQSTAPDVRIILDNVKIITSGINATAADLLQATITNSTFDVNNPFIINRHGSEFYGVDLRGEQASEISYCDFYGGQGCLCFKGKFSDIHHNNFINRQTVTNHYSVMAMGDGSRVFANLFKPEMGSGLEIFRHKNIEIFNNEFYINAAPPSCEYNRHLSTNGIRMADYGALKGSPDGCYGVRVYNNKFFITGRKYDKYPDYIPMASAFFYSASAGDNEIFGNDIIINQENPESDAEAFAFYIGNADGGRIFNNHIISDVTPVWVGSSYGKAENTDIADNVFEKAPAARIAFLPVRMGSYEQAVCTASGIRFSSNEFVGMDFGVTATDQHHSYSVAWTLTVVFRDRNGKLLSKREIVLKDRNGKEVLRQTSDDNGTIRAELPEYEVDGNSTTFYSPYMIIAGTKKTQIELNKNTILDLELK
jgi:hypothetical protein